MYARSVSVSPSPDRRRSARFLVLGIALSPPRLTQRPRALDRRQTRLDRARKRQKKPVPRGNKLKTVQTQRQESQKVQEGQRRIKETGERRREKHQPLRSPGTQADSGNEAVPFLEKYLFNSTFTDCPAGWPNCIGRAALQPHLWRLLLLLPPDLGRRAPTSSTAPRPTRCRTSSSRPTAPGPSTSSVENSGGSSFYEWHVTTNGAVNGAYQFNGGAFEQIGGLQYVSGARDCSY